MPDIFDRIEWKVREIFGEELVCVHVGDVEECDIKRHPTYPKFRDQAISSGVQSASSSRLWESMIAMGRLCDLDGDDTWRLVILDCIVPCFRSLSTRISRDFQVEREEIRSAMVAAALEVWESTAMGVSPRHVRDRMVKAAFEVAFRLGNTTSPEYSMDDVEILAQPEIFAQDSTLSASSIIDIASIRDADAAEQLGGERVGALFQVLGHFDVLRGFHDGLRTGSRKGSVSQAVRTGLSRSWISDPNLYYYVSDLYPSFIGLREAAGVMGIAESAAYRLIRAGQFPFPAARAGRGYKISVKALMHFKNIPDAIVHVDDVENGALHASGGR
ncbi:helix-turn-helix domain-containing protein [Streptomyces sp. NBC_01435]|uniref:helix-turn-helix domain-containing protein n=1 Tax=Streptomyces sp. NBC_01435 TaxID=2903865 RepID=UPI002E362A18|nr:helix-turn-helix domain-containing protein [Streptomyces sp. NBC_01435]